MKNCGLKYWLVLLLPVLLSEIKAENDTIDVRFSGQVVAWSTFQFGNPLVIQPGGRFVPSFTGKWNVSNRSFVDFETSLNINGNITFEDWKYNNVDGQIKPYRLWARYATDNFELRGGLQKINFGTAKMFRPLMWFDGMDVRDPLQLTDGVYGLLAKYFFQNNANIWLWGSIGNENRKG